LPSFGADVLDYQPNFSLVCALFFCYFVSAGTTWTQHIVLPLLLAERRYAAKTTTTSSNSDEPDLIYNHVSEYAPFFEIDAHWDHENNALTEFIETNHDRLNQRVFNTHLRWDIVCFQEKSVNINFSETNYLQSK
jgi:hypothetical protein